MIQPRGFLRSLSVHFGSPIEWTTLKKECWFIQDPGLKLIWKSPRFVPYRDNLSQFVVNLTSLVQLDWWLGRRSATPRYTLLHSALIVFSWPLAQLFIAFFYNETRPRSQPVLNLSCVVISCVVHESSPLFYHYNNNATVDRKCTDAKISHIAEVLVSKHRHIRFRSSSVHQWDVECRVVESCTIKDLYSRRGAGTGGGGSKCMPYIQKQYREKNGYIGYIGANQQKRTSTTNITSITPKYEFLRQSILPLSVTKEIPPQVIIT